MKKWTLLAALALACGTTTSGKSSNPDDGELSTFEQFSLWGKGMAGFTAPPSNQVAGTTDTGGWGDDGGWDDTGGWGDDDWDGEASEDTGACFYEMDAVCIDDVLSDDCEEYEGIWAGAGTTCDIFGMSSMDSTIGLEHTTFYSRTVGGVK